MLQKMGAAEVYDYRTEGLPEKISKEHPNLNAALDCISEGGTQSLCIRSLGAKGGLVTVLLKPEKDAMALRDNVTIKHTLWVPVDCHCGTAFYEALITMLTLVHMNRIYTALGHPFSYGPATFNEEQVKGDRQFMLQFTSGDEGLFHKLFSKKFVTGNRIALQKGGLENVTDGLKKLEEGQVRLAMRQSLQRHTYLTCSRCLLPTAGLC